MSGPTFLAQPNVYKGNLNNAVSLAMGDDFVVSLLGTSSTRKAVLAAAVPQPLWITRLGGFVVSSGTTASIFSAGFAELFLASSNNDVTGMALGSGIIMPMQVTTSANTTVFEIRDLGTNPFYLNPSIASFVQLRISLLGASTAAATNTLNGRCVMESQPIDLSLPVTPVISSQGYNPATERLY